jgi:hypothetical protein
MMIRGLARGYEPLLFVTLPEMPYRKVVVPFSAEPVENVGRNPLRSTTKRSQYNHFFGQSRRKRP